MNTQADVRELNTELQLSSPDDVYDALVSLLEKLGDEAAMSGLAALALVLANHVGNDAVVLEAIERVGKAYRDAQAVDGGASADGPPRILVSEALRRFFDQNPDDGMDDFAA